jgi:hypothetical protein
MEAVLAEAAFTVVAVPASLAEALEAADFAAAGSAEATVVMAATATADIAITAIAAATLDIMVDTTNLPTAFLSKVTS